MSNRGCVPFVVQGVTAFTLCVAFLSVSCGGGGTSAPPALQSIAVSPGNATVAAGLTQQYTATGNYSDGSSQPLNSLTWTTSDTTLATVNTTGLVTTLKQGQVTVSAASGTIVGKTELTVGPAILQSLSVSPQNATVAAGLTRQFTATGTFSDGTSKTVSAVAWSVSDTTLATVNSSGLVTTLKQGTVTIIAASGSISNTAPLNVGPPIPTALNIVPANDKVLIGATAPTKLSAILTLSDGSTADVSTAAAWSVTNSFIASIDTSGNVTTLRTGFTGVTATGGSFTANTGFTAIAEPRYLYFPSQAGRLVSKAIIDYESGQPFMAGYIQSGEPTSTSLAFPCPTTDPLNQFLYVGAYVVATPISQGEIQIYSMNPASGALTPVTNSPFLSSPVSCIDFEPTGKFGFASVAVNNATFLVTYSRDVSTGLLAVTNTMDLKAVPSRAAIDPLGQYLYVAVSTDFFNTTSGLGFSIDPSTGALTALPGPPFKFSNLGGSPTFHPSGNYLFVANSNGQSIDTYSVTRATGALTFTSSIPTCINPTPVRFSPDGGFAYTTCSMNANHNVNPSLESFAVGPSGALTHIGSTSSLVLASDVTVDPSGQFLYLSSLQPNILEATVGNNGVAGPVRSVGVQSNPSQSNVVVGGPTEVASTPKTAYVTSTSDNTVSAYSVNVDGTLTMQQSLGTFPSPFSLSLWPWGTDLVLATEGPIPDIDFFLLSPTTDLLTSNGTLANATTAGGAAIDPSGQFAFQTDSANGVVYTYEKVSGGGWVLVTYVGTPPVTSFPAGPGAGPIVIDPSGSLVYVANRAANSISAYEYFGISPQLIPTTGSPFAIGAAPLLMAIDPAESFLYVVCGDQTLRVFSISYFSGGTVTQVASVPLGGQPSGLTVEPNGGFVYTSDTTGVSAFSVNAQTGALTVVPLSPAITLSNTTGVFAEPSGQYLYVTTGAQNVPGAVFGYSVNGDGTLTAISTSPLATPKLPSSMVFSDTIQ